MITKMLPMTDKERQDLIDRANEVRRHSYAPYSNYPVGAALRTKSGRVFTGVNVEYAAYPSSMCAERTAIFKAVSEGERAFDVISVVTDNGAYPCGSCRQVLAEFGQDTTVLIANGKGELVEETTVKDLLPGAFTPEKLKIK